LGLGAVLGCASVFGPPACLDIPSGLGAASAFHGKTPLPSGFVGTCDCHLSTQSKFAYQRSPNWAQNGKRRINTIFDHFRDKPARQLGLEEATNHSCLARLIPLEFIMYLKIYLHFFAEYSSNH
jgi:hypothetical protein